MWDGVTSAAAWAGTEQGGGTGQGATQAGGVLPAGSAWFMPRAAGSDAAQAVAPTRYTTPAAAQPAGGGFAAPQRFAAPPAAAPMPAQPFVPQSVPQQRYPVGAQSALPPR